MSHRHPSLHSLADLALACCFWCSVVAVGCLQQLWVVVASGDGGNGWHWPGVVNGVCSRGKGVGG